MQLNGQKKPWRHGGRLNAESLCVARMQCNSRHDEQLSQRSTSVPHHDMTTKPHTCLITFTNQHELNMPDMFLFPRRTFYKACWMPQLSQTNATINHAMDLTRRSAQRLNTAPNHGRAPFNAGQRGHQENTGLTIRKFLRFTANRGCWAGFSAPGASESLISVPAHPVSSLLILISGKRRGWRAGHVAYTPCTFSSPTPRFFFKIRLFGLVFSTTVVQSMARRGRGREEGGERPKSSGNREEAGRGEGREARQGRTGRGWGMLKGT